MNYTLEDLQNAWGEGYSRANWEEFGGKYEPPSSFPEFMHKHFPQDTTYQWRLTYLLDGQEEAYEIITANNADEAYKLAYRYLATKGFHPISYRVVKRDLVHGQYLWDCKHPNASVCQYDIEIDPMMDSCVFCGEPQERK